MIKIGEVTKEQYDGAIFDVPKDAYFSDAYKKYLFDLEKKDTSPGYYEQRFEQLSNEQKTQMEIRTPDDLIWYTLSRPITDKGVQNMVNGVLGYLRGEGTFSPSGNPFTVKVLKASFGFSTMKQWSLDYQSAYTR